MKISIFIICHHKPWLIRSSLLSLFSQDDLHNYDLHFIMIKGNGEIRSNKNYKHYFKLKKLTGEKNTQLSQFDKKVFKELKKLKIKYYVHNFQNDHGLDSGAWIKLIRSKYWAKYDYSLMLMEGFLFSSNNVLKSLRKFLKDYKPDFISSGHEKRFLEIDKNFIKNLPANNFYEISTKKIWSRLFKIRNVKSLYIKSKNYVIRNNKKVKNITEHHVSKYSLTLIQFVKMFIKSIVFSGHIYNKGQSLLVTTNRKLFININQVDNKYIKISGIKYHSESNPFFFGCSCQHIFSKRMMMEVNKFFKKNKIYEISQLPYFGQVFEVFWGVLPRLLKKKKWYFDGIHRVRKNLITYNREDDINGVVKYLNFYDSGNIKFFIKNKNIQYKILSKKKSNIIKYIK